MKFQEYGADQNDTILLLHGGGLSWWNYREAAEILQREYHIILMLPLVAAQKILSYCRDFQTD